MERLEPWSHDGFVQMIFRMSIGWFLGSMLILGVYCVPFHCRSMDPFSTKTVSEKTFWVQVAPRDSGSVKENCWKASDLKKNDTKTTENN